MFFFLYFRRSIILNDKCVDATKLYDDSFFNNVDYPIPFTKFKFMDDNASYAGQGHFSIVRKRKLVTGETVAVKDIRIFSKKSLVKELQTLLALKGSKNTLQIVGLTGNESHPTVIYSYHTHTPNCYENMSLPDFKWWLKATLEALESIHAKGIIHRDINLGNVLCDLEKRKVTLIDFGISEFYRPSLKRNSKIGCIRIKAPELIAERHDFDCGIDIWSLGICCLDMMLGLKGNWEAKNVDMIKNNIEKYFGHEWAVYARRNGIKVRKQKRDIFELAMPGTYQLINNQTIDIVQQLLTIDPKYRPSASQLLQHPIFKDVE